MRDRIRANPIAAALGFVVLAGLGAVALYLFQPWQLFIDTEVNEDFPVAMASPVPGDSPVPAASMEPDVTMSEEMPEAQPERLVTGTFRDRSHPATGTAAIYRLADGSLTLRLEDFETDNGPDLFVYLSDAPADAPAGDFDAGFVNLGRLKGNVGNQNYEVPADLDLSRYTTVAIWCDRFDVVFGTAPLA